MSKVLLYTSIFGAYDELLEVPAQSIAHDSRCYTDQGFQSLTWQGAMTGGGFSKFIQAYSFQKDWAQHQVYFTKGDVLLVRLVSTSYQNTDRDWDQN